MSEMGHPQNPNQTVKLLPNVLGSELTLYDEHMAGVEEYDLSHTAQTPLVPVDRWFGLSIVHKSLFWTESLVLCEERNIDGQIDSGFVYILFSIMCISTLGFGVLLYFV